MSNSNIKIGDTEYQVFSTRLRGPKLNWFCRKLRAAGLMYHISPAQGMHGSILMIEVGGFDLAGTLLHEQIAKVTLGEGLGQETLVIHLDDLDNDHPWFVSLMEYENSYGGVAPENQTLSLVAPLPLAEAGPLTEEDEAEEAQAPVEIEITTESAVPTEEDDDDWGEEEDVPVDDPYKGEEYKLAPELLKTVEIQFPKLKKPLLMYEVESSNLSMIGFKPSKDDENTGTFYCRFKGSMYYRYNPVTLLAYQEIVSEAVRRHQGQQEASAGSTYHTLIKVSAEAGDIKTQKFDEPNDRWVMVLPKSERKATLKKKHEGA